ncbi:MAG: class I SAM-dependent methyltransferase [FCB group bacterium]|nr:class I SAM-dependent methyltransferase [FCB group bacterium]
MTGNSPVCPLCEKRETGLHLKLPDRFKTVGELYSIYACNNCSFVFLHPLYSEAEAAQYYAGEDYDPFMEVEGARTFVQKIYARVKPWALNWKAGLITKYAPKPGMLLDVGAGTGAFLHTMTARGWDAEGVEKDPHAARFGRDKLGLKVFNGDLADFQDPGSLFDIITFWHSLEHIHRLHENLNRASGLLKTAGHLFIALPNFKSLDAIIYRERWAAWDAPRHLWHFSPEVLDSLVVKFGFTLQRIIPMPLDPFYNSLLSEGTINAGGKFLRYAVRLPMIAAASYLAGSVNPRLGSSVVYCFKKQ